MKRGHRGLAALFFILVALAAPEDSPANGLALEPVVSGLPQPVGITHAGDGSGRLFIVLQEGRIVTVRTEATGGVLAGTPFLDISDRVSCCGERGLLGAAFHPDYADNGLFFVNYTDGAGTTVVSRFRVSADPARADAASESVLLTIEQPFGNHNGGQLQFGPDGFLYIGTGDGGSGGDPENNAQNFGTLLGKLLRIDVDRGDPYGVPDDNPFVSVPTRRDEIWAYGLRNPWRFSFDRVTGDLFIADVGHRAWEEINFQPSGAPGGRNYGWRLMEGTHCFNPPSGCVNPRLTLPVIEYGHDPGCAVSGGYVYRGSRNPSLVGTFYYGDYCSGQIWGAVRDTHGVWSVRKALETGLRIATFGEDGDGELYIADYRPENGRIFRIVAPLVISPPSGRYARRQAVEPTLLINLSGRDVTTVTALLDGADVTGPLTECVRAGTTIAGGRSFRCPGLTAGDFGPGVHRFSVELRLSDGSVVRDTATWEMLGGDEDGGGLP